MPAFPLLHLFLLPARSFHSSYHIVSSPIPLHACVIFSCLCNFTTPPPFPTIDIFLFPHCVYVYLYSPWQLEDKNMTSLCMRRTDTFSLLLLAWMHGVVWFHGLHRDFCTCFPALHAHTPAYTPPHHHPSLPMLHLPYLLLPFSSFHSDVW